VPATCPMGRSLAVLRGYSGISQQDRLPAPVLVRRTRALIPKPIVRPGTFRAHGVVIGRETVRAAEIVIAGQSQRCVFSGPATSGSRSGL
jgi:hypothetical protein